MKFMNTWDIDQAVVRWRSHEVLSKATRLLADLRDLANNCSDGWAYWLKPVRAARKLMELIEDSEGKATEADLRKAVAPIKAFYTREKKQLEGRTLSFPT